MASSSNWTRILASHAGHYGFEPRRGHLKGDIMIFYIQCTLTSNGSFKVAYIREEFAVVGKVVKLKERGWEDGWVVKEVYSHSKSTEQHVEEHERDYKRFSYED